MTEANNQTSTETATLTANVVCAFIGNNSFKADDLPDLIRKVGRAFSERLGTSTPKAEEVAPTPAVSVKKSITPDYLISLEDGRQYKSLKRHLSTRGMTPDEYRAKWGLPRDYPMTAPNYSAQRSQLAKALGLGQIGRGSQAAVAPVETEKAPSRTRRKAA